MALKPCRECGKEISTEAQACPYCGAPAKAPELPVSPVPVPAKSGSTAARLVILVILVIVLLVVWNARQEDAQRAALAELFTPAPTPQFAGPVLEIQSWGWSHEPGSGWVNVRGEVKNISDSPLKNVQAVASMYGERDLFITSADALVEFNPILPGQVSPFRVIVQWNPEMKVARLQMKDLLGGSLAYRLKDTLPKP
jgi:hypothetical protein